MRDIKFRAWNKKNKVMCYANEDHTITGVLIARC